VPPVISSFKPLINPIRRRETMATTAKTHLRQRTTGTQTLLVTFEVGVIRWRFEVTTGGARRPRWRRGRRRVAIDWTTWHHDRCVFVVGANQPGMGSGARLLRWGGRSSCTDREVTTKE
jgi:hypothetical protein